MIRRPPRSTPFPTRRSSDLVAALEAQEGQGVFVLRVLGGPQQLHAKNLRIEIDGALEVANAQHGVEDSHPSIVPGFRHLFSCPPSAAVIPSRTGLAPSRRSGTSGSDGIWPESIQPLIQLSVEF